MQKKPVGDNASFGRPEPSPPSDEILVRRLRDGDSAAGEELVSRYGAPLLHYLRRMVSNHHLAEELHQRTWLSVLEHLDRFDASGGGFKSWIFRIATNKANDYWRSYARDRAATGAMRFTAIEEAPPAGVRLEAAQEHDKLRLAIETLPETQRQVLLLRYYGNLKFVEIAEMLGCPLNTALGRMHKAMVRLKTLMSEAVSSA